MVVWPHKF
jgi:hypothetical protein